MPSRRPWNPSECRTCRFPATQIPRRAPLDAIGGPICFSLLSEPLQVNDRRIKYRFARQKASYLSSALARLASGSPPLDSGKSLRNWLLRSPGIGLKTASWIARNWLTANDVAILDIHVLRAGALGGFFDESLTVERNYLELESQFLRFSQAIGAWPSELDAVLWFEMTNSPLSVSELMGGRRSRVRPSVPRYGFFGCLVSATSRQKLHRPPPSQPHRVTERPTVLQSLRAGRSSNRALPPT
jgi:hypothetical protein